MSVREHMNFSLIFLVIITFNSTSAVELSHENISSIITEIGGTFCSYFAAKAHHFKIPRKLFVNCSAPKCDWDSWHDAINSQLPRFRKRIVLSYAHNGFGNQLWEHTVAFMFAESMSARLLIAPVPTALCPDHLYSTAPPCFPPHTLEGINAMTKMLPDNFEYDLLPSTSLEHILCENETFFFSDRPRDWREAKYKENFLARAIDILTDPNPRCIKILGFFQDMPLCRDDTLRLWKPRVIANFTRRPGPHDISIYLRCIRHYHFNNGSFYEHILDKTRFERVWLFQAPECDRYGPAVSLLKILHSKYNATRCDVHSIYTSTTRQ